MALGSAIIVLSVWKSFMSWIWRSHNPLSLMLSASSS
jgi:hypothetical protein